MTLKNTKIITAGYAGYGKVYWDKLKRTMDLEEKWYFKGVLLFLNAGAEGWDVALGHWTNRVLQEFASCSEMKGSLDGGNRATV